MSSKYHSWHVAVLPFPQRFGHRPAEVLLTVFCFDDSIIQKKNPFSLETTRAAGSCEAAELQEPSGGLTLVVCAGLSASELVEQPTHPRYVHGGCRAEIVTRDYPGAALKCHTPTHGWSPLPFAWTRTRFSTICRSLVHFLHFCKG